MKELEKTKRLSIAAILTILVVIIALVSYKRPKHLYESNTKDALTKITTEKYLINQSELTSNDALIDIRNRFDFDKGHIENAINIPSPEILNNEHTNILNNLKAENKQLVLYGNNPEEAIMPYMLLTQLGFNNAKVLCVANSYDQNKLITKEVAIEKSEADISAFIQESVKKTQEAMAKLKTSSLAPKTTPKAAPAPKKVVPVKKKKKAPVEGGC